MKKILCSLLAAAVLITAAAFSAAASSTYLRGDANGDGEISIDDAAEIQLVLAQIKPDSNGGVKRRGNVSGNNLDISDATEIQRYLAEFGNPCEIGKVIHYDEYELPFIPA